MTNRKPNPNRFEHKLFDTQLNIHPLLKLSDEQVEKYLTELMVTYTGYDYIHFRRNGVTYHAFGVGYHKQVGAQSE